LSRLFTGKEWFVVKEKRKSGEMETYTRDDRDGAKVERPFCALIKSFVQKLSRAIVLGGEQFLFLGDTDLEHLSISLQSVAIEVIGFETEETLLQSTSLVSDKRYLSCSVLLFLPGSAGAICGR
jgi:hypothetical protein